MYQYEFINCDKCKMLITGGNWVWGMWEIFVLSV